MPDAGPDLVYERMRLERQRKQIEITVVDQRIQLIDLEEERGRLVLQGEELSQPVEEGPKPKTEKERLVADLASKRHDLASFTVDMRLAEIDGQVQRLERNIEASAVALADLSTQIENMAR